MHEKLTEYELSARLNFYKNHVRYLNEEQKKSNKELENARAEIKELKNELDRVKDLLKLALKGKYGASSEKVEDREQLTLFEDEENKVTSAPVKREVKSYTRAPKRSYEEIYKDLPVEIKEYDIPDAEKICEKCGTEMVCIGYDSYKEIEYTPAVLKVIEHKKKKYACKKCDQTDVSGNIKTASSPLPLFDHSLVSPSLLAYIINEKFCKAVPLYRLEQDLHRMGVNISRQTMSNWLIAGAELLRPLYDCMHGLLLREKILHADETPLQVNHADGRDKPVNGYMWVYRTGKYSRNQIILYDYRNGRKGAYPAEFLKDFSGYLHCDGLRQYDDVIKATRAGCWAHVRRYFKNAMDVQHDKRDYTTLAGRGFLKIQKIFAAETETPERSPYSLAEIAAIRKEKSQKLTEDFFEFCGKNQGIALPRSLTGRAINYALGQQKSLMTFLLDPRIELTNNAAERAVKPFVIGRKNWLFSNTEKGAHASATLYSIVETAKSAGAKPFDFLRRIFEKLRSCDFGTFEELLPWNINLTEEY